MNKKELAVEIAKRLKEDNPKSRSELNYNNEMEFSIAVALSAQTTDKKVNEITEKLFKKYKSWEDFANSDLEEITATVRGVNFHKGKAQRLKKMGRMVLDDFGGSLPRTLSELIKLPGVARKTANVIMMEMWKTAEGVVVDTHVKRLANRWGLTTETDPKKVEKALMELIPKEYWVNFGNSAVLHGRYVCKARSPNCSECFLNDICPSANSF